MCNKIRGLPSPNQALAGREQAIEVNTIHAVNHNKIHIPTDTTLAVALLGMGCFWGAERKFWSLDGVYSTSVGYAAGLTKNATYEEVCSGLTGHNEVVRIVYEPKMIDYDALLAIFWESHNPTQGYQQGNDKGTQYRSGIYYYNDVQKQLADESKERYQRILHERGYDEITTEIIPAPTFYFAEDYHQQYLHKNPSGYCGLGGLNIPF